MTATVAPPARTAMAKGGTTRSTRSCRASTSAHEPGQEVAPAEAGEPGGSQALEPLVEPHPQVGRAPGRRRRGRRAARRSGTAPATGRRTGRRRWPRRGPRSRAARRPGRSASPRWPAARCRRPTDAAPSTRRQREPPGDGPGQPQRAPDRRPLGDGRRLDAHAGLPAGATEVDDPVGERRRARGGGRRAARSAPHASRPDRVEHAGLGGAVEVGRRLVEQQRAARRGGTRGPGHPLALAGRQPGAPLAEPRVAARRAAGRPRATRPASSIGRRHLVVVASGPAQADVVGDRRGEQVRALGHPGDAAGATPSGSSVGQVDVAHPDRARARARRSRAARASSVDLPHPLGPVMATISPGCTVSDTSLERRLRAARDR